MSAQTGEVLQIDDLVRGAAESWAYLTNPVKGGLAPQRITLENLLGGGTLSGSFARVYSYFPNLLGLVPPDESGQLARADRQGDFLFSIADPRFTEVQLYHNMNRDMNRVSARFRLLGFRGIDRPLDGVVYWPEAFFIGPFYSPLGLQGRGGLFFAPFLPSLGDPTFDADVIFHEYTHAVVNSIVGPTKSNSFGALNEAYADYFSSSFQRDPYVAEFAGPVLVPVIPTCDLF